LELREPMLALSDLAQTVSYCLIETPIPMCKPSGLSACYGNRRAIALLHWEIAVTTLARRQEDITRIVAEQIIQTGFETFARHLQEDA